MGSNDVSPMEDADGDGGEGTFQALIDLLLKDLPDEALSRRSQEDRFPENAKFREILENQQIVVDRLPETDSRVDQDLMRIDP